MWSLNKKGVVLVEFNKDLLDEYKKLIQTTNLEKAYQEFISLFRYVKIQLEKQLQDYRFQSNIVENAMDYSYFQFTNDRLKQNGLKIAVTFVHREFKFEVWLSGFNRKIQCKYHDKLKLYNTSFELTNEPNRTDFILRTVVENVDIYETESIILAIKTAALQLIECADKLIS